MFIPLSLLEKFILLACLSIFCRFLYCVLIPVRLPSVPCRTALFPTLVVPSLLLGYHPTEKSITTLQFHRKLAHEMMVNKIGVDTVDSWRLRRSTCTPDIVPCKLLKVEKHEGSYNIKAKNSKKSNRNIKNRDAPTLKLATNGL